MSPVPHWYIPFDFYTRPAEVYLYLQHIRKTRKHGHAREHMSNVVERRRWRGGGLTKKEAIAGDTTVSQQFGLSCGAPVHYPCFVRAKQLEVRLIRTDSF